MKVRGFSQPHARLLLLPFVVAAGTCLLLSAIPVMPWRASCYTEPVPGPYRPIFLKNVSEWLAGNDVYYWRLGDLILLRLVPIFDGYRSITRETILLNIGKISLMLEDDVTIDGVLYPKPPAVREIEARPPGTWDLRDVCRAAIRPSPTDPRLP